MGFLLITCSRTWPMGGSWTNGCSTSSAASVRSSRRRSSSSPRKRACSPNASASLASFASGWWSAVSAATRTAVAIMSTAAKSGLRRTMARQALAALGFLWSSSCRRNTHRRLTRPSKRTHRRSAAPALPARRPSGAEHRCGRRCRSLRVPLGPRCQDGSTRRPLRNKRRRCSRRKLRLDPQERPLMRRERTSSPRTQLYTLCPATGRRTREGACPSLTAAPCPWPRRHLVLEGHLGSVPMEARRRAAVD
mmetsp:Transcript_20641/g.57512  ORF Transcript_20641/g.57512 Transcript_20641/m.57512 type:complete len:250 (-) Transcript_20641:1001-1750(-)